MRRLLVVLLGACLTLAAAGCQLSPVTLSTAPASTIPSSVATQPPTVPPTDALQPVSELVRYTLDLINKDRADYSLPPVALGSNAAAQQHAENMFREFYLSHWDTDGMKPYIRYTQAGGVNNETENSAYSGWFDKSEDPRRYRPIDAKEEIAELEYQMMYDDAISNWGHRDNILNKWHKRVNIGIACDEHRLALVQQFEGDYLSFSQPPILQDRTLVIIGQTALGVVDSIAVYFDPLPAPLTQSELQAKPRSYSLGPLVATVIPPPPPGYHYTDLPPNAIQAEYWNAEPPGSFSVRAAFGPILETDGPGVYTVLIWTKTGGEYVALSNYSIFVR
jgi:uncharacterized protein YkwD